MNGNWWGRDDELELERVANEEGPRKARSRIPRCLIPKRSNFYQNRFGHFLAKFGQTQTLNRPSKTDFFVSLSFLFPTQRPLLASWRRHYNGRRYVMYPPITMCLLHPIGLEEWGQSISLVCWGPYLNMASGRDIFFSWALNHSLKKLKVLSRYFESSFDRWCRSAWRWGYQSESLGSRKWGNGYGINRLSQTEP